MMFTCPVCFYGQLEDPPINYNICDCCGTEFDNDDSVASHDDLRGAWMNAGTPWFFGHPPYGWNAWTQLVSANVILPYYAASISYGGPSVHGSMYPQHAIEIGTQDEEFALALAS
jgi:hypothetical protein